MIQTLNIENVALIDRATLEFDEKLNVISGETGAGKSILLDSLSFVFGGRADRSLIRTGANSMKVEAIFSYVNLKQAKLIKQNYDIDCDDELFVVKDSLKPYFNNTQNENLSVNKLRKKVLIDPRIRGGIEN